MATTTYTLDKIKINGVLQDLFAKADEENVTVHYNGSKIKLKQAMNIIANSIAVLPDKNAVSKAVSDAIDGLIGGAPETYDTLKKIADYISTHQTAADALDAAITNKVDKVEGKGLSAEDFTTALKNKLESMTSVTSDDVTNCNPKADKTAATTTADGLMSAADKTKLDGLHGVRYGATVPEDMQDGELFILVK